MFLGNTSEDCHKTCSVLSFDRFLYLPVPPVFTHVTAFSDGHTLFLLTAVSTSTLGRLNILFLYIPETSLGKQRYGTTHSFQTPIMNQNQMAPVRSVWILASAVNPSKPYKGQCANLANNSVFKSFNTRYRYACVCVFLYS